MRKTPLGASGTLLESAARKMRGLDWERLAIFYARIALGAAFLSGIASRFGLGRPQSPNWFWELP